MNRAIIVLLAACAALAPPAAASAQGNAKGTSYVESRGGPDAVATPAGNATNASGGAAGHYVADGVAVEAEGIRYGVDKDAKTPSPHRAAGKEDVNKTTGVSAMARWDVVRTPKGAVSVGAGGGGVFSDKELPNGNARQAGAGQADLGASVAIGKNASLKASGRYQQLGAFSDKSMDSLGGNIGLKISF